LLTLLEHVLAGEESLEDCTDSGSSTGGIASKLAKMVFDEEAR